jgi:hypothetical protein
MHSSSTVYRVNLSRQAASLTLPMQRFHDRLALYNPFVTVVKKRKHAWNVQTQRQVTAEGPDRWCHGGWFLSCGEQ